jgi:hypothetical protein
MNLINDQWSKERGDKFRKYFLTHRPFLNRNKIALTVQKWPNHLRHGGRIQNAMSGWFGAFFASNRVCQQIFENNTSKNDKRN